VGIVKLELGAGHRPTIGYTHNDLYAFDHIEVVGNPWMLDLPDNSVDEVLALAFIEHLTFDQARDTFRNVRRMLKSGGIFYFDVPDYPAWLHYYLDNTIGEPCPFDLDAVRKTLFGWGRWPGDEHKYGWDAEHLSDTLGQCGLTAVSWDVEPFIDRAYRQRFHNPADAHLYVTAAK
jgi:predicted SAM-dependent methyltransferase